MIKLNIQFFGGRGSAGGNAKAAAEKSVAAAANNTATLTQRAETTEKKPAERRSSTPTRQELDKEPMGTAYMSPNGYVYVKQDNANDASWTDYRGQNQGYGINSSDLAKRMEKAEFTKLPANSTFLAAGSYRPTDKTAQSSITQRKATAPERQIRAIDRKLSNGSSMTKMGSGNAGQYVVELGKKDASSRRLANELKKAGFRQVGNNRWVKNGV